MKAFRAFLVEPGARAAQVARGNLAGPGVEGQLELELGGPDRAAQVARFGRAAAQVVQDAAAHL